MTTKLAPAPTHLPLDLRRACLRARRMDPNTLRAIALARGCRHYAPLWPELSPRNRLLPHEVLGCALLIGPANADTFQSIRCGAMVLSDRRNSPARMIAVAREFGVTGRLAHIARLGWSADVRPKFWQAVLDRLPEVTAGEEDFLPGVSRFVAETRRSGPGQGPVRTWLRTAYPR